MQRKANTTVIDKQMQHFYKNKHTEVCLHIAAICNEIKERQS